MKERTKTILIGLFVITALVAVSLSLVFLNPKLGNGGQTLHVRFSNIEKISVGTRVTYAGKAVGEVDAIHALKPPAVSPAGEVHPYELVILIDSSVPVYTTDQISLHTSGLMGERSIEITPKRIQGAPAERIPNGGLVYYTKGASLEDTVADFSNLANKAEAVLEEIHVILKSNYEGIGATMEALEQGLSRFDSILKVVQDVQLVETLQGTLQEVRTGLGALNEKAFFHHVGDLSSHVNSITEAMNRPASLSTIVDNAAHFTDELNKLYPSVADGVTHFANSGKSFHSILDKIDNKEGSIGKLLSDEALYLQIRGLLTKGSVMMDDVNHYGVLFHLNKSWQRQRTRRANQYLELSSAKDFQNYFQQELNQIETSLSRVSWAMDRTQEDQRNNGNLADNSQFNKHFLELLERVHGVKERLDAYNTQLQQQSNTR